MSNPANRPSGLPLELPDDLPVQYANLVRISHTPAEFVLDFAALLPAQPHTKVLSRLLMSPVGVKSFYRALGENLARYEATFGEISLPGDLSLAQDLFRSTPPAEGPAEE